MRNRRLFLEALISVGLLLAVLPTFAGEAASALSAQERREGFVPLFNGRDFSGWVVPDASWQIKDGVLVCTGKPGGWLRSEKKYENFILRGEFKISKGGNSGVFVRAPMFGRASRIGMEMQILDDYGQPPTKTSTGSIYDAVAPAKNASKPAGEWNSFEITCNSRRVRIVLNGVEVVNVNLDDPAINASLPETHKLYKRQRRGYIGLQNHGSYVEFRNLRLKELN